MTSQYNAPGSKAPEILTFGCRLNAYESEVMRRHANNAGLRDAVIVNTCAVTAEAERQARQAIRKARRAHPESQIIVTGCAAQINPERYAAMTEVDRVVGNEAKLQPETFGPSKHPRVQVNDIMEVRQTAAHLIDGFEDRTRAFVQVQQGCDHRCTFCVIPYGRGNSRSVPIGDVVQQVRLLVERGVKEVVLTGVDVTSYGADLPGQPSLGQMMRRLLAQVPSLPRLRVSSIDAVEIDTDFLRLIAEEPRLMPHLHLSLQAGDDMILKRMKRRHSREHAIVLCKDVRALRPEVVFGADLIAGFPTETDEMFANSLRLVEDCGLTYLHVFPYSARPETPAARMPQVPTQVRKARAAKLRDAGAAAERHFLDAQIGRTVEVLLEQQRPDGSIVGRSEHFAPVVVPVGGPGKIQPVLITERTGSELRGQVLPDRRTDSAA